MTALSVGFGCDGDHCSEVLRDRRAKSPFWFESGEALERWDEGGGVYGYVPVDVLEALITRHGGREGVVKRTARRLSRYVSGRREKEKVPGPRLLVDDEPS